MIITMNIESFINELLSKFDVVLSDENVGLDMSSDTIFDIISTLIINETSINLNLSSLVEVIGIISLEFILGENNLDLIINSGLFNLNVSVEELVEANIVTPTVTITKDDMLEIAEKASYIYKLINNESIGISLDGSKVMINDEELLINERLDALDKHFDFPLYYVFKEIIVLYDTQGGSIIDMSMQLLNQIDIYMKNIETIYLDNNKKIGEVLFLWIFSTFALIYVKSILVDYYVILIDNSTFKYIIFGFLFLFIFSTFILSKKYIEIKLGE